MVLKNLCDFATLRDYITNVRRTAVRLYRQSLRKNFTPFSRSFGTLRVTKLKKNLCESLRILSALCGKTIHSKKKMRPTTTAFYSIIGN